MIVFSGIQGISQTALLQNKIVASDREANDQFGDDRAVAIFKDYAVVGTKREDSDGNNEGKAYLYKWNPNTCTWFEIDTIVGVDDVGNLVSENNDFFGCSVAIYGEMIAIGAWGDDNNGPDGLGTVESEAGIVYIFKIVADEAEFVENVYQYNNSLPGGAEDQQPSADQFGFSVDLSASHLIVGSPGEDYDDLGGAMIPWAGGAFIYELISGSYVFRNKITAPVREGDDQFGMSVAIDGDQAAVGAPRDDWAGEGSPPWGDGLVYIFEEVGSDWNFVQVLIPPVETPHPDWDWFGYSIDMWEDRLIVGAWVDAHNEVGIADFGPLTPGSAYIYEFDGSNWILAQKIVASDRAPGDAFGFDVAIYEDYAIVGANREDNIGGSDAGSAYLFHHDGSNWIETQKIMAIDGEGSDHLGFAVDIHEKRFIVSAPFQGYDEDIVDITDPELPDAGAAYMYEIVDLAEEPVIVSDMDATCVEGLEVTLTIDSGDLGDATDWYWYEDDCETISIGTGTTIVVTPTETTTYCARGESYCEWFTPGDCGCITVEVDEGSWHQSTDDGLYDQANDVITDAEGSVYITGVYVNQTTFDGGIFAPETIMAGTFSRKSYVAKYDNCANLRWVAFAEGTLSSDSDYGTSIALDEASGLVYAVGIFRDSIHYNGGIGEDAGASGFAGTSGTGEQGYVACFNMNDGDVNFVDLVSLDPYTRLQAITVNQDNGRIYVGGERAIFPGQTKAFVQRYSPSLTSIGTADWLINGLDYHRESVSDLAYAHDGGGDDGSLWIIGGYKYSFAFSPGTAFIGSNYLDAYVARYIDDVVPNQVFLKKGNVNGKMFGEGIAVNEDAGIAYITGQYQGVATDAFEMPGQNLPSNIYQHAYFMAIDNFGNPVWPSARFTFGSPAVTVNGYSVAVSDNEVYYTGSYADNTIWFSGGPPLNYFSGSMNEPHVYVVAYHGNTGNYLWNNATMEPTGMAKHIPNAITTDEFGNAYVVGGYSQYMDYISGSPFSGILTSTAEFETFVMRVDPGSSGAFEIVSQEMDISESLVELDNLDKIRLEEKEIFNKVKGISIMPNPVRGMTIIELKDYVKDDVYHLKLISMDGKEVLTAKLSESRTSLDLSGLNSGVYMVQVINNNNNEVQHTKLVIGN